MTAPGTTGGRRLADPPRVRWNAADYHAHASAQSAWGRELHARIALRPDEVVFDLGCGDGRLTAELADRLPAGRVYGLDADGDMIAFARRTHARDNTVFVEGDVRTFSLCERASLIVSSAASTRSPGCSRLQGRRLRPPVLSCCSRVRCPTEE